MLGVSWSHSHGVSTPPNRPFPSRVQMVLQSPRPSPWASTWKLPGSWKLEATWLEPQHPQIFWGGILGVGKRSVPQGITFGNLEKIHTAEEVQNSTCKVVTGNVQRFIITNSHHHMITVTITSSPPNHPRPTPSSFAYPWDWWMLLKFCGRPMLKVSTL